MTAYAVGILQDIEMGPPIVEYLERIDATLARYGGQFIVHGAEPQMCEGDNPGTLVIIEFPAPSDARQWYESDSYQAIIPLRATNSTSTILLIDGVDREHRATDVLRP